MVPLECGIVFDQVSERLHYGADGICPCDLVYKSKPRSRSCDVLGTGKSVMADRMDSDRSNTSLYEFQASKNDSVSAKLEFGLIDYDSILCTEGKVVPSVEEGLFNIGVIEEGVINNFDLSRYIHL